MKNKKSGFTLVELMLVMVVLGVALLVILVFGGLGAYAAVKASPEVFEKPKITKTETHLTDISYNDKNEPVKYEHCNLCDCKKTVEKNTQ